MTEQGKYREEKVNTKSILRYAAYFLCVIIVAFSIAAMAVTGGNLNGFYNAVDHWSLNSEFLNGYSCSGMIRLPEQELVEITEEEAVAALLLPRSPEGYPYLELNIRMQQGEGMRAQIAYYNESGFLSEDTEEITLKNGRQYILLNHAEADATRIGLHIYDQKGRQFWIESGAMWERIRDWSITDIVRLALMLAAVEGLLLAGAGYVRKRRKVQRPILTDFIYGVWELMEAIAGKVKAPVLSSAASTGICRMALFFFMLLFQQYLDMGGRATWRTIARERLFVYTVILFIISILSIEKEKSRRRTVSPFIKVWVILGMICICSEFIVEKRLLGRGIFMFFVLGFFFYVWSGMKKPQMLLLDFTRALELTFWINAVYCLLFRPMVSGLRYTGFTSNPNIYMMYLLPELTAVLMGMYRNWIKQQNVHLLIRSLGMGAGMLYLNETGCRTGFLGIVLAFLVVGISVFVRCRGGKKQQLAMVFVAFLFVLAGVVFSYVAGHAELVYGVERFLDKLKQDMSLDEFSSGRVSIYVKYLGEMNLWGHEYRESINGIKYDAHNGILTMGYLYGILIIIPYLTWLFMYVKYAVGYWRNYIWKEAFAIFPLLVAGALFPVLLFENLEQFLRWPVWLVFYIPAGMLFREDIYDRDEVITIEGCSINKKKETSL